jgi:predicted enzyme involved in methoxymalonyl-ACP biosynthesis
VIICRPSGGGTWEIDTWLMSCRVLGRKVEHMVLREILRHARAAKVEKLIGIYKPTERNQLVADHYAKLGFTRVEQDPQAQTRWELRVEGACPESAPMRVVSADLPAKEVQLA